MNISIITSLFNRLDLTRVYLESLERTLARWDYEVILIDDGSTDGTRQFLATLPAPRYRVVLNEAPRGFAANNNVGARMARAPLLCLLNNDTFLLPGWLDPMARLAHWDPGVGLVGNVQREPVSGLIDHFGTYFRPGSGLPIHAGKNRAAAPREPYLAWPAVTAACCVIRRALFEELGGFDEDYRNGFEDIDLCLRATARGYRHFVANRSVIYHHVSASPGRRKHEDENEARFQARWQGRVPIGMPDVVGIDDLRREGSRYLRKHLLRPWRYNYGRVSRALEQRLTPWPPDSRPPWPLRAAFGVANAVRPTAKVSSTDHETEENPFVYLLMEDTVQNPGRSGIQTVVRSLAGALGRLRAPVRIVLWDEMEAGLRLLPPDLSAGLEAEPLRDPAAPSGPLHALPGRSLPPPGAWILMPELMYRPRSTQLVDYARRHGWRLALIFHDAIPVTHPEVVPPALPALHAGYMEDFARADLILPVSEASARDWRAFVAARQSPQARVVPCLLASDVSGVPRARPEEIAALPVPGSIHPGRLLCISTLEPRKNHRALLAAYELATAARPGLRLELDLVGAPYKGAPEIAEDVRRFVDRHEDRVRWHAQVEYSLLRRLYEAADFTVYPSILEGFGLPIIESLWFGRPCVCANFGVMAENAAGGGCLPVDVRDSQALADAIISLAESPEKRHALALAATTAPAQDLGRIRNGSFAEFACLAEQCRLRGGTERCTGGGPPPACAQQRFSKGWSYSDERCCVLEHIRRGIILAIFVTAQCTGDVRAAKP